MNETKYMQQLVELDIKEAIWKLLSQWKALLLTAVIVALLMGAAAYIKDTRAYESAVEAAKQAEAEQSVSADERLENALSSVTAEDRSVIEQILRQKRLINEEKEYLDNSIWINTDPMNQRDLKLEYYITINDEADMQALVDAYNACLLQEEYADKLKSVIDADAKTEYIYELYGGHSGAIADSDVSSTLYVVEIILPEDVDADEIISITDNEMKSLCGKLSSKITPHTIKLISTEENHIISNNVLDRRINIAYTINNLSGSITNATNALSQDQRFVLEKALKAMDSADAISGDLADDSSEAAASTAADVIPGPSWSIKHTFIGFIVGAFLYVGAFVAFLILKGCINSAKSLQSFTRKRLVGEIYYDSEPSGFSKLMHSKLVNKYHYRRKSDPDTQIGKTMDSISALCEHSGEGSLTMLDLTAKKEKVHNILTSMMAEAGKKGLDAAVVEADGELDEKELLGIKNAVLAVSADTKAAAIGKIMSICNDYDISPLGNVYISEM